MTRHLARRLARLEARSGHRWYVAEVGADWQGDVAAALGLTAGDGKTLVVVQHYGEPDAPPRLVNATDPLAARPEA